jgi:thioredoxin:protein disulfide reductase
MNRLPLIALCAACLFTAAATPAQDRLIPKRAPTPDFLPVDEAFELQPLEWRDGQLTVTWRIAPEYYLYRGRLQFALDEPAGIPLAPPPLPKGEDHEDEFFGKTEIYRDRLEIRLPLAAPPAAKTAKLTVVYQGCADAGLCYPPQTRTLEAKR